MTKGLQTRERILDHAFRVASRDGLEGLSIGVLAAELGLSKSGLFAHFGSKEDLQLGVLERAAARFAETVVRPALQGAPRGEPRVRALFEGWLRWLADPGMPGGCLFAAVAAELDDREGRPRDFLVDSQRQLLDTVARSARLAVEAGHFRADLDCEQFAFDVLAIVLATQHQHRLLREPRAEVRARTAFERLLTTARPSPPPPHHP